MRKAYGFSSSVLGGGVGTRGSFQFSGSVHLAVLLEVWHHSESPDFPVEAPDSPEDRGRPENGSATGAMRKQTYIPMTKTCTIKLRNKKDEMTKLYLMVSM